MIHGVRISLIIALVGTLVGAALETLLGSCLDRAENA